jgi:hypothetical protein
MQMFGREYCSNSAELVSTHAASIQCHHLLRGGLLASVHYVHCAVLCFGLL